MLRLPQSTGQTRHSIEEAQESDGKCATHWVQRVLPTTTVEENRLKVLQAKLDELESDPNDYAELSKERVLADFRRHILSECCLPANLRQRTNYVPCLK